MNKKWDVIIVGAGPAGAMMAYELARGGAKIAVFDSSHPREKACAGFLDTQIFNLHPLLQNFNQWFLYERERTFTAPSGHSFTLSKQQALTTLNICSRKKFDQFLIQSAEREGAWWIKEKVLDVEQQDNKWRVFTKNHAYQAHLIIGADGGNSLVRKKLISPFKQEDLLLARGNLYEGNNEVNLHVIFLKQGGVGFLLPGYSFSQIVVGRRLPKSSHINKSLQFLTNFFPGDWSSPTRTWATLQPVPMSKHFFKQKCSGENYCLLGDAAGHVHPVKGEGILFSLHGAILAAKCCLEDRPADFDMVWKDVHGIDLEKKAAQLRRAPGEWGINLMAWAFAKSETLKELVINNAKRKKGPFYSSISHAGLHLPKIFSELFRS